MCAKAISENRCHMFEGKIWTLYRKVWRDKCSNCNMFSKTEEETKKWNSLSILFSFNIYKTIYYYKMPICRVRHSWSVNSHCDCISIFQPEGFYSTSSQDIKGFQCAYKSVHKFPLSSPDKAQSLLVSSSDVVADWSWCKETVAGKSKLWKSILNSASSHNSYKVLHSLSLTWNKYLKSLYLLEPFISVKYIFGCNRQNYMHW